MRLVEVSPAGRAALDAIDAARREMMARAVADWSAADVGELERLLTQLAEQAEGHYRGGALQT